MQALRRPGCAQQLRYLGLAANGIGEAGGCSLAGWLGEPGVPLQTIELRDNQLGDRAASALADMLCRNRQPRPQGGDATLGSGAARPAVPPQRVWLPALASSAGSSAPQGSSARTLAHSGSHRNITQPATSLHPSPQPSAPQPASQPAPQPATHVFQAPAATCCYA